MLDDRIDAKEPPVLHHSVDEGSSSDFSDHWPVLDEDTDGRGFVASIAYIFPKLVQLLLILRHEDDAVVVGFLSSDAIIESLYN